MRPLAALLACLCLFATVSTARADIVTIEFSAPLDNVGPLARNMFALGAPATIRYTFETTTPPSDVTGTTATYPSLRSLEVSIRTIGGGTYTARATRGIVVVSNNIPGYGGIGDHYFAGATNQRPNFDLVAPPIAGYTVTGVYLSLWDASATAFDSLAQPRTVDSTRFVPSPAAPREGITIRFDGPVNPGFVSASLPAGQATLGPPTNLRAVVTGATVSLAWTPPAGQVLGYRLEVGNASGQSNLASAPVGPTPSFVAVSVPNGRYYVRVRAIGAAGDSPPSNEVVVDVGAVGCTSAPGPPAGLTATVNGSIVTLSFSAGSGCPATQYSLHVGTTAGASNIAIVNLGALRSVTAAAPPGTFYVRAYAQNAYGSSGPSNEAIVRVGGGSLPNVTGTWTLTRTGNESWIRTYSTFTVTLVQNGQNLSGTILPAGRTIPNTLTPGAGRVGSDGSVFFGIESLGAYWNDDSDAYFFLTVDPTGTRMTGTCNAPATCTSATAVRIR